MLEVWIAWLDATSLARALRASVWVYPLVNAGHILGIALLVGAITAFDLRLLGWRREITASALARVLLPVARSGFALAVVSGLLLFITRAPDYIHHPVFHLKLGALALALLNIAALRHSSKWADLLESGHSSTRVGVAAVVSLAAWLAVLVAGRLIGYR